MIRLSLKSQLYLIATLPVVVMSIIFTIYSVRASFVLQQKLAISESQTLAKSFAESINIQNLKKMTPAGLKAQCDLYLSNPIVESLVVRDSENRIILNCPILYVRTSNPNNLYSIPITSSTNLTMKSNVIKGKVELITKDISLMNVFADSYVKDVLFVVVLALLLVALICLLCIRRTATMIGHIASAAKQLREGDYNISFDETLTGDVGAIQDSLVLIGKTVNLSRGELEHIVYERTLGLHKERKYTEFLNNQRKKLINQMHYSIEIDRKKIAADLHDTTNTVILSILGHARKINSLIANTSQVPTEAIIENAASIEKNANYLYSLSRDLVANLKPEILDEFGLGEALQELVNIQKKANPQCKYTCSYPENFPDFSYDFNIVVYRIVQESLSNITKYAKAKKCVVELSFSEHEKGYEVSLRIIDDGIGFDTTRSSTGTGILSMKERAESIKATLTINSEKGTGTSFLFKYIGQLT